MQISHITHVQMLFEQHLQTINDYVIPTTDILERARKGKEKGPNLGQAVPCFTQCQPKQQIQLLRLTADPLRSSTQII